MAKLLPEACAAVLPARPEQAQIWAWGCFEGGHSQRARITMADKRTIEIFCSGGSVCEEVVQRVRERACDSCEVTVLDIHDSGVADRAQALGIKTVPAVAIDGRLVQPGVDVSALPITSADMQ